MNRSSFYTEIWVPKLGADYKKCFKSINELLSFDVILSIWMKTQPIMITLTIESTNSHSRMESSCVDPFWN
jgi:hypothetical protein